MKWLKAMQSRVCTLCWLLNSFSVHACRQFVFEFVDGGWQNRCRFLSLSHAPVRLSACLPVTDHRSLFVNCSYWGAGDAGSAGKASNYASLFKVSPRQPCSNSANSVLQGCALGGLSALLLPVSLVVRDQGYSNAGHAIAFAASF